MEVVVWFLVLLLTGPALQDPENAVDFVIEMLTVFGFYVRDTELGLAIVAFLTALGAH